MVEVISFGKSPFLGYLQFTVPSMLSARQGVAHSIDLVGSPDGSQGDRPPCACLLPTAFATWSSDAALLCSARNRKTAYVGHVNHTGARAG